MQPPPLSIQEPFHHHNETLLDTLLHYILNNLSTRRDHNYIHSTYKSEGISGLEFGNLLWAVRGSNNGVCAYCLVTLNLPKAWMVNQSSGERQ